LLVLMRLVLVLLRMLLRLLKVVMLDVLEMLT